MTVKRIIRVHRIYQGVGGKIIQLGDYDIEDPNLLGLTEFLLEGDFAKSILEEEPQKAKKQAKAKPSKNREQLTEG